HRSSISLVGFYANIKFKEIETPIPLIDTITDPAVKEQIQKDIESGIIKDDEEFSILNKCKYICIAEKDTSVILPKPLEMQPKGKDLGIKQYGQAPYYIVDEDKSVKPENVEALLKKAQSEHEALLNSEEYDTEEVENTIRKIQDVLDQYFGKQKQRRYWNVHPSNLPETGNLMEFWDEWQQKGIVTTWWRELAGEYGDKILECSDYDAFLAAYKKVYDDPTSLTLWRFLHEMQEGDVILVNRGQQSMVGQGTITSPAKIDLDLDFPFYRNVKWEVFPAELPIPPYLKKKFGPVVRELSETEYREIMSPKPPEHPLFKPIRHVLENKKQVILYGPPGTGKTYHSKQFIENHSIELPKLQKTSFDQKFFWLSVNKKKYDPEDIFTSSKSAAWQGRLKSAFESIEEGDYIFIYATTPFKKIIGIAECQRKFIAEDGIPTINIQGIQKIDGPEWAILKEDEIFSVSIPVRNGAQGTLFPLTEIEAMQMLSLSGLTPEDLKISSTIEDEAIDNKEFIAFHPSFGYEDFIEGLRPIASDDGIINYCVEEGIFKKFCRHALNVLISKAGIEKHWDESGNLPKFDKTEKIKLKTLAQEVPFYFVIDEINRGDISRIFGELISLLESDKRLCEENELVATLPYSKHKFAIPPNIFIIGTMNTADKSIALVDIALRRRFGFIEMMPQIGVLEENLQNGSESTQEIFDLSIDVLKRVNQQITSLYDRDHQIGHSYLLKMKDATSRDDAIAQLWFVWYYEILPLLQEYFYDSPRKLKEILGDVVEVENHAFTFKEPLHGDAFIAHCRQLAGREAEEETGEECD
ncbi:AAA family ATPase, partial [Methanocalculus sp.]|uniref:AAA family ATPase n=1 Tax=Methanocalculus sp. TaxID=2004547 RepID=UPI00261DE01E